MIFRVQVAGIPMDAACLDGHFPGNPIVPGAMLLGHAARKLAERGGVLASVNRMKFLRPLLPDQPFEIDVTENAIKWIVDGETIAQARIVLKSS